MPYGKEIALVLLIIHWMLPYSFCANVCICEKESLWQSYQNWKILYKTNRKIKLKKKNDEAGAIIDPHIKKCFAKIQRKWRSIIKLTERAVWLWSFSTFLLYLLFFWNNKG